MCSVGPGGSSWAINSKNKILYRAGAKSSNPIGTKWQEISGQLIHISVGKAGVWGITPEHQVKKNLFYIYYLLYFLEDAECKYSHSQILKTALDILDSPGINVITAVHTVH